MASSRDPPSSRPVSGSFPRHPATSRQHSHSISLAATNPSHRVNRRKSVNAAASSTATAAVAAALREQGDASMIPVSNHRRSLGSRKGVESQSMNARPSMHTYFAGETHGGLDATEMDHDLVAEVLDDGSLDDDITPHKALSTKNRNRRASEGSHLIKGGGKRVTSEVRCDTCGKGYKHSSCLTKHMWEHDPAWAYTSKLLISKHQQVQLLEAAKVLYTMTSDDIDQPQERAHIEQSESSGSPLYSGSSDHQDDFSSVETTPPPMSEGAYPVPDVKRYSTSSAGYSRSYRSIPSSSFAESAISPGLPPYRLSGVDLRPSTSGTDDSSLAAAAEMLTFIGTPRTKATHLGSDVPPVPPLPQQYQSYSKLSGSTATPTVYNPLSMHPPALTQPVSDERDFRMDEGAGRKASLSHTHASAHVEDEGMFKMEE